MATEVAGVKKKRGKFIVFEGIDGSGTSTQAHLLKHNLEQVGMANHETREPSDGPIGQMIRAALTRRINFAQDKTLFDHQMAFLYAADRHDHLYNPVDGVLTLLDQGVHVICTRYYFSSFAYNADDDHRAFVAQMNSKFPDPDLVIYLRGDVDISLSRMDGTRIKDVYENEDKMSMVARNFELIFMNYTKPLVQIDAQLSTKEISQKVFTAFMDLISE